MKELTLKKFPFSYWKTLIYTVKCKQAEMQNKKAEQKKWFGRLVNEDSDVALVRIFECFLESAPQKILQISIILSGEESITGKHLIHIQFHLIHIQFYSLELLLPYC